MDLVDIAVAEKGRLGPRPRQPIPGPARPLQQRAGQVRQVEEVGRQAAQAEIQEFAQRVLGGGQGGEQLTDGRRQRPQRLLPLLPPEGLQAGQQAVHQVRPLHHVHVQLQRSVRLGEQAVEKVEQEQPEFALDGGLQPGEAPKTGLEKPGFFKKPSQVGFLVFFVFLGFFWVFCFFLVFLYICPEERVFRVFSVSRILLGASRL